MRTKGILIVGVAAALTLASLLKATREGEAVVVDEEGAKLVAEPNNAFAVDLYAKLKDAEGNLFFSPLSISTALAMTYAGARGDTAAQMAEVLHFDLPQDRLCGRLELLGGGAAHFLLETRGQLVERLGDDRVEHRVGPRDG